MNSLTVFNYGQQHVRTVAINGEPWFVAKDLTEILGYQWNGSARISHVPEEWKGVTSIVTPGGEQEMAVLSEQGVYFFLGRSDKKAALPMQKWIAGDVLPQIRKTGTYNTIDPLQVLNDPASMRHLLLTYTEKVLVLEETVRDQAPKVAALDRIATAEGSMCITSAAKHLQVRPKDLFAHLVQNVWIYRRTGNKSYLGYQARIQQGLVEHKVTTHINSDGFERVYEQVRITPKGLARLANELEKEAA
ncbi:MAG: phage antirepressor KilAC domain-containing protein [Pseudomonadota bacterium]